MKFALGVFGAVVGLAAGTTIDGEGAVTVIGTVVFDDNLTIESGSTLVLAGNAIVQDSRATAGNLGRRETTPTMLMKWQDTTPTMPKQSATRVVVVDVDVQHGQQPTPISSPTSASPIIEPASFPWTMAYSPTPTPLASTGSHNTDIVLHRGRLTDSFFYSAAVVASQRSVGTAAVVDSSTTSIPVSLSQDAAELEGEVQAPRVRHGLRARANVNIVHNGNSSFATHFSSYNTPRLREK